MKIRSSRASILIIFFLLIAEITTAQKQLYSITNDTGFIVQKFDSVLMGPSIKIRIDKLLLQSVQNEEIKILLPGGISVVAKKEKQLKDELGFSWVGKIKNQSNSFVLLTQVGDVFAGHIRTQQNRLYKLSYIGNDVHIINTIQQKYFSPDIAEPGGLYVKSFSTTERVANCCDNDTIDALFVYTPAALRSEGSESGMMAQLIAGRDITNRSFDNNNIPTAINIVYTQQVDYTEVANIRDMLNAITDPHDGVLDSIHYWRDQYSADVVVLVVEASRSIEGYTYILDSLAPEYESLAFCVVQRLGMVSNLTLAHEIGHILGARHECNDDMGITPFIYAHGYSDMNTFYRTIMSNNSGATKLEYWSDPLINFPGTTFPMGSLTGWCQANDAECLRNTISLVSNYRCKRQCETMGRSYAIEMPPPEPKKSNLLLWIALGVIILGIIIWLIIKKRQ